MWLEILGNKESLFVNTEAITSIHLQYGNVTLMNGGNSFSTFYFDEPEESKAFFEGFKLALNGLNFKMGEGESLCYIKPLRAAKNKILHEHLMLQEVLNESIVD